VSNPTEQKLHILHLSGRPKWCGESNRVLVECAGLIARGHEVLLGTSPSSALAERGRERGVPVHAGFRFSKGLRPLDTLHDVRELKKLLASRPFDIVHIHTPRDTWPAAIALGPNPAGLGTWNLEPGTPRVARPLLIRTKHHSLTTHTNLAHRWLYGSRIDHLILASGKLRETISELTGDTTLSDERIHVIHSSIDVHRFDPATTNPAKIRAEFGLAEKIVIGLIGRVSVEKGHAILLNALEKLRVEKPEVVCLFVGEGDQLDDLKSRVASGPLRDGVIFTGPRRDIPDITAALDIQAVPSLWLEASPAVVKEAMAMNVPVIASDVGGVSEIIEDGRDGLLVPPGDETALLNALRRLIGDENLRRSISSSGREKIMREFSDEKLVERSMALYEKLLGRDR
jgi:glycosyltransferase involved in cell wall biosynthesis